MGPTHYSGGITKPKCCKSGTENDRTVKDGNKLSSQLWRPYLDDVTNNNRTTSSPCHWMNSRRPAQETYELDPNTSKDFLFRPITFPQPETTIVSQSRYGDEFRRRYAVHCHPDARKTPEFVYEERASPVQRPSPGGTDSTTSPDSANSSYIYSPTSSVSHNSCCSPSPSIASVDDVKMSPKIMRGKERLSSGSMKRNHPYSSSNSERLKRSKFTEKQLTCLNEAFYKKTYLTLQERHDLASKLDLTEEQVKNWFQNKRMKTKRDYIHAVDKGLLIPLENPGLPKFSRMPVNYFMSLPVSPVKFGTTNQHRD